MDTRCRRDPISCRRPIGWPRPQPRGPRASGREAEASGLRRPGSGARHVTDSRGKLSAVCRLAVLRLYSSIPIPISQPKQQRRRLAFGFGFGWPTWETVQTGRVSRTAGPALRFGSRRRIWQVAARPGLLLFGPKGRVEGQKPRAYPLRSVYTQSHSQSDFNMFSFSFNIIYG